jgi:hypothetical protein
MVVTLTFRDVTKHLNWGGGLSEDFPDIWTSMLKIYLKCNNYNRAFSDSEEMGGVGILPQKIFTFRISGIFLKQVRKQIG